MSVLTRRCGMERKIVQKLLLGRGINQISRELGVSKRRVMMVRGKADEAGYLEGRTVLPPYPEALFVELPDGRATRVSPAWRELELRREWISERLRAGWHAVTVFEELAVKVPRSNFYRFLERHCLNEIGRMRRVVPEIVHEPGEALLVDLGYLWTVEEGGRRKKLWVFVGVLGYSRYLVAQVMSCCDLEHTLEALCGFYAELGGVPQRTTSDNPKVFTLKANRYEPLLNPVYERFASHYGTIIECLPPKDPQKKGKVERPIPYIRRLLESYRGDRNDLEAIQKHLCYKLEIANNRKHGSTLERPAVRFREEEQPKLKALPVLAYEREHYHEGAVRIDGHVRFQGKYYSVEERYIRQAVTVLGNSEQVLIYHAGKLIETHQRVTDRAHTKSTKRHHLKPWEQICNNPDGLRGLAAKLGPFVHNFVEALLKRGDGYIDLRPIWGILSLEKKYPREAIDAACARALWDDELSYRTVVRYLQEQAQEESQEEAPRQLPCGKFQRDLREYSQLLLTFEKGDAYEH